MHHAMQLHLYEAEVNGVPTGSTYWILCCACGWKPSEAQSYRAFTREDHRTLYRRHVARSRNMVEEHAARRRIEALDRRLAYMRGGDPTP